MKELIADLIQEGYLRSDRLKKAFLEINREEFLPRELKNQAWVNAALPIGSGQTISQPLTVAFMLELLAPQEGNRILDIGSGSGWTTALLAFIVGKKGKVIALERLKELVDFGERNVRKFGFVQEGRVEFYQKDGTRGFLEQAPFDRILISAAAREIPEPLKAQLKIGGKLVGPVGHSIVFLEKKGESDFFEKEFPGFIFVPLVENS